MGHSCFYSVKIICVFLFILAGATSSQNTRCPFQYLYHFGDGVTDIGNAVRIEPDLPATRLPYGITFPGTPNGRWSDGRNDFDYGGANFGFPVITPSLSGNASSSNAVIFSVALSPVLEHSFFLSRGVIIPPYAVPLSVQLLWFKTYLKSVCSTPSACANRLRNSLVLLGDIEGNDIGYSLTQGKSIEEVQTYVPFIIRAQMNAARELIRMGTTTLVIPGNSPIGCYPYILTALQTNDSTAYDDLGCLKSVNDLITFKNNVLQQAINNLKNEFPNVSIFYGAYGEGVLAYLTQVSAGPNGNNALKACCGVGGKYNYDSKRLCGSQGVPFCSNPEQYIFWDGLHFTQEAFFRIEEMQVQPALVALNCTLSFSM